MTLDDKAGADQSARTGRRRIALMVGWFVILAVVAAGGFLLWRELDQSRSRLEAAEEAENAGRRAALHMVTYDAKTLEEDFSWVADDGTKRFVEAFSKSADQVKELAEATQARSEGVVLASGTHIDSATSVSVVVALDSALTTPGELEPSQQRWRIKLSMVERDGRWLVDQLELL